MMPQAQASSSASMFIDVHEREPVNLPGVILLLSPAVHKGDPVDLAGGVRLFGHGQKT